MYNVSGMPNKSKGKATSSPVSRIANFIRSLKNTRYRSQAEYFESISNAAELFGNAAMALSRLEASHLAAGQITQLHMSRTLEVTPTGNPEKDYRKIQFAIDHANPGDRVLLKSGIFRSAGVVWVWKDISIEGEPGAVLEGTTQHSGKVIADPSINGGFILIGNPNVEIKNIHFRHLYFAIASGSFNSILLLNNFFEDIYQSVYLNSGTGTLVARNNQFLITSLNQLSTRCRLNFFDESHLFGFYCNGAIRAVLENNRLEISELTGSQQFHVIGVYCSGKEAALIRGNFFKGWHAPIAMHHSRHATIINNEIHGMCEDSEYRPIGIFLKNCHEPVVCSNAITNRGLGTGAIAIAASGTKKGRILANRINMSRDANAGIMIHKSNGMMVGQNIVGAIPCPIGVFGDQSEDVKENLLFCNIIEGNADIQMAYASDNTVIGPSNNALGDRENALIGYNVEITDGMPGRLDEVSRHQRVFEHIGRNVWPAVPKKYLSGE